MSTAKATKRADEMKRIQAARLAPPKNTRELADRIGVLARYLVGGHTNPGQKKAGSAKSRGR
jgi:hypothetical protein